MAASTQPLVINLLLAKINGLGLKIGQVPVTVVDGSPGPNQPDNFVAVMALPTDQTRGRADWEDTAKARIENYDVMVHIWSYVGGGPDVNGLSAAQAQARANAAAIEAPIETALLQDANLSVQNGGTAAATYVLVAGIDYSQTTMDDGDGEGRYAQFDLTVHVYNYLPGA